MAKRVGTEDKVVDFATRKGADAPGAAPELTNQVVTEGSFLNAVKDLTKARADVQAANEVYKQRRKAWKASGIVLGALDKAVKMAEWSRPEIRDNFAVERQYAEWLGLPVDMGQGNFIGKSDDEVQKLEWAAIGKTFSRTGKAGRPPEECPPEYHQAFMRGFNEEDEAAWADSEEEVVAEEPTLSGGVLETHPMTGEGPRDVVQTGSGIAEQKDLVLAQPKWKGYPDDIEDWFAAQWRDFNGWYETVPEGLVPEIKNKGVAEAFRLRREGLIDAGGQTIATVDSGADGSAAVH